MKVTAIKTRICLPPQDDLFSLIEKGFSGITLKERSVVVVTSKVVSIWQGRCIKIGEVDKDTLVKREADWYIDRDKVPQQLVILTIKDNLLIPTSGVDESNANGYYVLWPKQPFQAAKKIYSFIKEKYGLKDLGVVISDSHTTPLRSGVMGIALAYWGFNPLRDYRGKEDIFGRKLKLSQANIADSLAASAVFVMGEGNEQTPVALIEDLEGVEFMTTDFSNANPLLIDADIDIYSPLIKSGKWAKGENV